MSSTINAYANTLQKDSQIKQISFQLNIVNDLNQRLADELKKCQSRLGLEHFIPESVVDNSRVMNNFPGELQYLTALLVSYDQTINSLMKERKQQQDIEEQVHNKVQVIVQENDDLRRELLNKCQQMVKMQQNGGEGGGANMMKELYQLEKDEQSQQLVLLREENDILQQKFIKCRDELFGCDQMLEKQKTIEKEGMQKVYEAMKRVQEQNELIDEQSHQLKLSQKQLALQTRTVTDTEQNLIQKEDELFDINNQFKIKKNQAANYRLELEEEKDRLGLEIEQLYRENETLRNKQLENSNKYVQNERDLDLVREDNRRLQKESEQVKQDNEQLMKMMESQESKILGFSKKEEEMQKMFRENREKTEEAVLQRDKAVLREEQYNKTIELVKGQLKQQMNEQREDYKRDKDRIISRYKVEVQDLQAQCEEQRRLITQLELESDQLTQENNSKDNEITHWNQQLSARAVFNEKAEDIEAKVIQLEENIFSIKKEAQFEVDQVLHQKKVLEIHNAKQQENIQQLKTQIQMYDDKQTQDNLEQSRITHIQAQKEQIQKDKESQRLQLINKIEEIKASHQNEIMDWKLQSEESRSRERQGKEKAIQLLKGFDQIEQKMKSEYETRIADLEQYVIHLKNSNKVLLKKTGGV